MDQDNIFYFAFFAREDPFSFDDVCHEDKWNEAMQEEIKSIERMKLGSSLIYLHTRNS